MSVGSEAWRSFLSLTVFCEKRKSPCRGSVLARKLERHLVWLFSPLSLSHSSLLARSLSLFHGGEEKGGPSLQELLPLITRFLWKKLANVSENPSVPTGRGIEEWSQKPEGTSAKQ